MIKLLSEGLLLFVESILLFLTVTLIYLSRREEKTRLETIDYIKRTIELLSRKNLLLNTVRLYDNAKEKVYSVASFSSQNGESESEEIKNILNSVEDCIQRDVDIRYLIPKEKNRLPLAYKSFKRGCRIKFHPDLRIEDLRYTIVDNEDVLWGKSPSEEKKGPTNIGYIISSSSLAKILSQCFLEHWDNSKAVNFEEYVKELSFDLDSSPISSVGTISDYLGLPEEFIEKCLRRNEC